MNKLIVSSSPHIRTKRETPAVMLDVVIALLPPMVAGVIIYGIPALAVVATCVLTSIVAEFLFNLITKREQTVFDFSAVVTGLILALNLPVHAPIWQCVLGSVFAIIVVKCLFGGLGANLVNPAITARVLMLVSFGAMAMPAMPTIVDTVASATPLSAPADAVTLLDLFLGVHGGAIGETSALALLIGFIYLLVRRVISWHIPVAFVGSAFVFTFLFGGFSLYGSLAAILSGGLLLGAIFMATDYVTSPVTPWGRIIFGVGAGLITVLIRLFGSYPEGVSFAILFMNILTPYIDRVVKRRVFGKGGKAA